MKKTNNIASWVIMALIAIAIIVWRMTCGWWCDDWVYNQNIDVSAYPDTLSAGASFWQKAHPEIQNVGDAFSSMYNHWLVVNGRMIHIIAFLSYLVPQWVVMLANGIMTCLLIYMLLTVCGCRYRSPLLLPLFVATFFIVLPWHDHMAASVFCMNYVWCSVMLLLVIYIYSRWKFDTPPSWLKVVAFSLLCLIVGSLYEAMSVAVLCGMTYVLIRSLVMRKGRVPFRYWVPGLCFALGTAICMFSPGNIRLLIERETFATLTPHYVKYIFGVQFWPVWVALLTILLMNIRKGWRAVLIAFRDNMFWIVAALVAAIIGGRQTGSGRFYWFMYLSAIVIFWKAISSSGIPERLTGKKSLIGAGIATCVVLYWLGTLAYWQNLYTQEEMRVYAELQRNVKDGKLDTNIFYVDLIPKGAAPWWLMYSYECMDDYDMIQRSNLYIHFAHKFESMIILPEKYRNIPPDSLPIIPGSAGLRGDYNVYYSPEKRDIGGVMVTWGMPPKYKPIGSVNRIYSLPYRFRDTAEISGSAYLEPIDVVRAPGDTLRYYRLQGVGRSLYALPILRVDTI